jgi:hypothetical protein
MQAWTNTSVRGFAGSSDPIAVITKRSKRVVMEAIQAGWRGPPFDPFELASLLGIKTSPTEDVSEARIVPHGEHFGIEYNPNRPRRRLRFSVAHEIAHTLFQDCAEVARNRGENHGGSDDGWQLELLCNLAASEFLMPTGDEINPEASPSVDTIIDLQSKFDVSTEAVAIRLAHVSKSPCTVAVAARLDDTDPSKGFRIDYSVPSRTSSLQIARGSVVRGTVLSQCTAVGYTAKGAERIAGRLQPVYLECVGIPPYPGMTYPRVLGIAQVSDSVRTDLPGIVMLRGSALDLRGSGRRIIAHIVNDKTANWGGDFSRALRDKYPSAQSQFHEWAAASSKNLKLGKIHISDLKEGLSVASLVAQHGYGPSPTPRIRYAALRDCLDQLCRVSLDRGAQVQMPRLGTGLARGNWSFISELLDECLVRPGVSVTVYTLPGEARADHKVLGGDIHRLDEAFPEPGGRDG